MKIISALLPLLPDSYEYRVVFMIRTLGFSTEEERIEAWRALWGREPWGRTSHLAI